MTDELFSREEVLKGLSGSRAKRLLFWIEARTAYMVLESRKAVRHFLGEEEPQDPTSDLIDDLGIALRAGTDQTIENLERYAPQWAGAVPDSPQTRATLIRLFGRKYRLSYEAVPHIRAALGMDDPAVQEAYEDLHSRSLETLFQPAEAAAGREQKPGPAGSDS